MVEGIQFELFSNKPLQFVRRKKGEEIIPACVQPTLKHGGGSVMVWGCFAGDSVGDLIQIEGKMKKEDLKKIIQNHAVLCGERLAGAGFTFQQDNDPKHTSKPCKQYLESLEKEKSLKIMVWPPQSPDLYPIELLREELYRFLQKSTITPPTNVKHQYQALLHAWKAISKETLRKLSGECRDSAKL